jgi:rubrerythrin
MQVLRFNLSKKELNMGVDFSKSATRINLMKAFAGESQARNRYTFAASVAKREKMPIIENLFLLTANQEKEHAKIFYNFLKPCSGEDISIDGADYPIDIFDSVCEFLIKAEKNELAEYEIIYSGFARKAKEEGFDEISDRFFKIAEIEKIHGERFRKFSELIEKDDLFSSKSQCEWICLNCGNIHRGLKVPESCPVCEHVFRYYLKNDNFIFF